MSPQNVGQITYDSSFLLDENASNDASKHESHTDISPSNMNYVLEHLE